MLEMVSCFIVINISIVNVGAVPVITVLTKADAFWVEAIGQLRDERVPMKKAKLRAGELADQLRSGARARIESQLSGCKYPPKAYILTACKYSLHLFWG